MRTRTLLLLPMAAALSLIAACGGGSSGSDDAVASLDTSAPGGTDPAATAVSDEDAALAYIECMRDAGVDLPDPVVADDGTLSFDASGVTVDPSSPEFVAANDGCGDLLEGVDFGISDDDMTKFRDAFQRFTDCLRGEGLDVGDFRFGDGNARRVVTGGDDLIELVAPAIDGLDPSNPDHQAAVEACEPVLSEAFDDMLGGGA